MEPACLPVTQGFAQPVRISQQSEYGSTKGGGGAAEKRTKLRKGVISSARMSFPASTAGSDYFIANVARRIIKYSKINANGVTHYLRFKMPSSYNYGCFFLGFTSVVFNTFIFKRSRRRNKRATEGKRLVIRCE